MPFSNLLHLLHAKNIYYSASPSAATGAHRSTASCRLFRVSEYLCFGESPPFFLTLLVLNPYRFSIVPRAYSFGGSAKFPHIAANSLALPTSVSSVLVRLNRCRSTA